MNRIKNLSFFLIIPLTLLFGFLYRYGDDFGSFFQHNKAVVSYYGSRGQEVIDIQDKLYKWGYYNGIVDGVFGYKTFKSVKLFQSKNGIVADGVVGQQTLSALGLSSQRTSKPIFNTNTSIGKDSNLLAHLIYGESRGEPYIGQVAVAAVVLNRIRDSRFPKSVASVIYQPGAFDAVSDGQINLAPNSTAINAAKDALNGWDPSGGAVYYYNPSTATSEWIWSKTIIKKIGNHNFAK